MHEVIGCCGQSTPLFFGVMLTRLQRTNILFSFWGSFCFSSSRAVSGRGFASWVFYCILVHECGNGFGLVWGFRQPRQGERWGLVLITNMDGLIRFLLG